MTAPFALARYHLELEARETLALPVYKGNPFRGGFGMVFRRLVCMCGESASEHQTSCLYAQVFETPREARLHELPQTTFVPHPFVIQPPLDTRRRYAPGERLSLHLVLFGDAIDLVSYFEAAFAELGRLGVGPHRARYALKRMDNVTTASPMPVFDAPTRTYLGPGPRLTLGDWHWAAEKVEAIDVDFLTYTRLGQQGKLRGEHHYTPLDFGFLFRALLRRLALLAYAHGQDDTLPLPTGEQVQAVDVVRYFYRRQAQDPAARAKIQDTYQLSTEVRMAHQRLDWHDWERHSSRQQARMPLGGLMGTVRYTGEMGPFLPLLRLGTYTHIGKNSVFGHGRMAVHPVPPIASATIGG